ncbi:hypothetical protein [Rhizobium wuzhouense]|uniref:DUF2807 domain-containing protein n=1 Tax=Rhizobium wuzhouense TaxID=1986026 RepID=A0ABX5P059_9HYPH|nr:hypothetical protein [Rhizobium wuzhouense]PYB76993.1 hypothetical protein DMY87_00965 [Rhizobium wuzhouense]
MRTRTIILSVLGGIVALAVIDGSIQMIQASEAISGPIDLAGVTRLDVTGSASDITIATRRDGPLQAVLSGTRHGWGALFRSAWFASGCAGQGRMTRDGDTLTVDMGDRGGFFGWNDWDDCTLTLNAQLAPEARVSIRQNAARMRLSGDFDRIDIDSDAGDFSFTGHAATIAARGAALRAKLAFERVMNTEQIQISGNMLDASLRFLVPTPISYGVEAVASYVDSALPNTPGAKPAILIRGEMVRVTIR